jgi:GNAT superfamily N-acetyltransferase
MENVEIIDTNPDNILNYGICGYKNINRAGYPEKIEWLKERFSEGMKIKTLYSKKDGTQGMIEYLPGEYCWRPVDAKGYMFIHCVFVGFKRAYKGKGYGSLILGECLKDAKKKKMNGVAVVTRDGSFMAGKEFFVKNGFKVVDTASPDFQLLVKKFKNKAPNPKFKGDWERKLNKYGKGLTIIRADQCPYTVKNVNEIRETAEKKYGIKPKIIDLKNYREAQNSPCAFGIFCLIYNGKILAHHPISNKRFQNIMDKELK